MITEDYVSFEIAKLLKEKGFDAKCSFVWAEQGNREPIRMAMPAFVEGEERADRKTVDIAAKDYINPYNAENNSVTGYLCPTLQMAMKWLREVHDLCLFVIPATIDNTFRAGYAIYPKCDNKWEWCASKNDGSKATFGCDINKEYCDSYEQACEAGIKYCLEHLI